MRPTSAEELVSERDLAFLAQMVPPDVAVYVSGSTVEGLGNECSDVDFFIMSAEDQSTLRQPALQSGYYIDCEYHSRDKLEHLAATHNRIAQSEAPESYVLPIGDLDLYYRTAIALPVNNSAEFLDVQRHFSVELHCRLYDIHGLQRAESYLLRARAALARGDELHALFATRSVAEWATTALLARGGEGYVSRKWRFEKAARLFGRSSPDYRRIWRLHNIGRRDARQYLAEVSDFAAEVGAVGKVPLPPWQIVLRTMDKQVETSDGLVLARDDVVVKVTGWAERLWRALDDSCDAHALVPIVSEWLDLTEADAELLIYAFLDDLQQRELIDRVAANEPDLAEPSPA